MYLIKLMKYCEEYKGICIPEYFSENGMRMGVWFVLSRERIDFLITFYPAMELFC